MSIRQKAMYDGLEVTFDYVIGLVVLYLSHIGMIPSYLNIRFFMLTISDLCGVTRYTRTPVPFV